MQQQKRAPRASGKGNTTIPRERTSCVKNWCFTLNNWTQLEYDGLITLFNGLQCPKIFIAKEIGEIEKTPHLQGFVEFPDKIRAIEHFKKEWPRIHWEPQKGTIRQNRVYCSKYDAKPYCKGVKKHRPLIILDTKKLWNWQKELVKIIEEDPDERTIHWYWEPEGKLGKTTFAKYLSHHYEAIPLDGEKKDILFCAATYESEVYIWDIERDNFKNISYRAIEKIKNGYYMSPKYESKPVIRNPPHVIIFANFPPDEDRLSQDRWHIVLVESDKVEVPSSPALRSARLPSVV